MQRFALILVSLLYILYVTGTNVQAQEPKKLDWSIGILHPGFEICNENNQCNRDWWLLDENMDLRDILTGLKIPANLEGYLIYVQGKRYENSFQVASYRVESYFRFGDLMGKVVRHFNDNFSCLMDTDRFKGKLKEVWSGEHNEVTLIFRFYSTGETPNANVELRYNGRTGQYLGKIQWPKSNPCQVRFW